jgi:hypothetical protein
VPLRPRILAVFAAKLQNMRHDMQIARLENEHPKLANQHVARPASPLQMSRRERRCRHLLIASSQMFDGAVLDRTMPNESKYEVPATLIIQRLKDTQSTLMGLHPYSEAFAQHAENHWPELEGVVVE